MTLRLFLLQPATVFAARVNLAAVTYPLAEVPYDGVSTGAYTDIQPEMTVLFGSSAGADNLGRQRVRKSADASKIYIGRSGRGTHDGEVDLVDNAYITVLDDYRVWAKIPRIDVDEEADPPTATVYKDHELTVGSYTTTPPPVANCGAGTAGTIDADTELLTVAFDGSTSFALAGTLASYLWDVADGTITVGTSADSVITATFPAGFRWVSLTVTDSNGKTHTARCPVFARDPAADSTISAFEITAHRIMVSGQQVSLEVFESIAAATYPDGTLVLLWEGEPASASDRSHMRLIGWHNTDPATIQAAQTGAQRSVTLECVDVAGRLDLLPWFPNELSNAAAPSTWSEFKDLTVKLFAHYVLHWHSTALDLADWTWQGVDAYAYPRLETYGESLFDQVNTLCSRLIPDHYLVCNRRGQMSVRPDPMVQAAADRTSTVQATLTAADWADLRYTQTRGPRYHWLYEGAVLTDTRTVADLPTPPDLDTVFARAPGTGSPGQGLTLQVDNVGIARSQNELNIAAGHRYARLNAPQSQYQITLAASDDYDLEPADLTWVALTLPAAVAAQRSLTLAAARGLVHSMALRYRHTAAGTPKTVDLEWERETSGRPATTYIPPVSTTQPGTGMPDDYWNDNPGGTTTPPAADPFYGTMKAYILWSGRRILRTWDITATDPTWELVDTGVSGGILDCQYVMVDADTVGVWALTYDGVFWCTDILAITPSWSHVLDYTTISASEVAPPEGISTFRGMIAHGATPGYLLVTTGPNQTGWLADYIHAYFWHTHDYGVNWTLVDHTADYWSSLGYDSGYCFTGPYGANMYRDAAGTIYVARMTQRIGLGGRTAVFRSTDFGGTWSKGYEIALASENRVLGVSLLNPYPNQDDPSYLVRGNTASVLYPLLYRSTDEWATGAEMSTWGSYPTGYPNISAHYRVNKRTFDTDHIIAWFISSDHGDARLHQTLDGGQSWSALWVDESILLTGPRSQWNTPNGWPPDGNEWVIVNNSEIRVFDADDIVVYRTTDNFSTVQDKSGNLPSLMSSWHGYEGEDSLYGFAERGETFADGFALPRVGANA